LRTTFVHVSSVLNLRGSEKWLFDASKILREGGCTIKIVTFDRNQSYPREEEPDRRRIANTALGGVSLVHAKALKLRLPAKARYLGRNARESVDQNLDFLPISRKFYQTLRDSDLIYFVQTNQRFIGLIFVLAYCALAGRKRVVAGIHAHIPTVGAFQSLALRIFSGIGVLRGVHTVNRGDEETMRRSLKCRVRDIPNGTYLPPRGVPNGRSFPSEKFSVLYVGALTKVKGADILPTVFDELLRRGVMFRLIICSSGGPLYDFILGWSRGKENVEFKGFVEWSKLEDIYGTSSVMLLPSRNEAFGIACVEGQGHGTPVIVSNATGFCESVLDNITGYRVKNYEPGSFANRIEEVYTMWKDDRVSYNLMCENAAKFSWERFRWEIVGPELLSFINQSASGH
jgi:glycosyltransferase involved in cell wall biosynthesis